MVVVTFRNDAGESVGRNVSGEIDGCVLTGWMDGKETEGRCVGDISQEISKHISKNTGEEIIQQI